MLCCVTIAACLILKKRELCPKQFVWDPASVCNWKLNFQSGKKNEGRIKETSVIFGQIM